MKNSSLINKLFTLQNLQNKNMIACHATINLFEIVFFYILTKNRLFDLLYINIVTFLQFFYLRIYKINNFRIVIDNFLILIT